MLNDDTVDVAEDELSELGILRPNQHIVHKNSGTDPLELSFAQVGSEMINHKMLSNQ